MNFGAKRPKPFPKSKAATFLSYFANVYVRRQWKRQKAKDISHKQPLKNGDYNGEEMSLTCHPFHTI